MTDKEKIKEEVIEEFWIRKDNIDENKVGGILLDKFMDPLIDLAISKTAQAIFDREQRMECLKCGKSLSTKILAKEIHLHFCEDCRAELIKEKIGVKNGKR